jgi:hypothetical protein
MPQELVGGGCREIGVSLIPPAAASLTHLRVAGVLPGSESQLSGQCDCRCHPILHQHRGALI